MSKTLNCYAIITKNNIAIDKITGRPMLFTKKRMAEAIGLEDKKIKRKHDSVDFYDLIADQWRLRPKISAPKRIIKTKKLHIKKIKLTFKVIKTK